MKAEYKIPLKGDQRAYAWVSYDRGSRSQFYIIRIYVPYDHRGQGLGSRLLTEIISDADKEEVRLSLDISSFGDLTFEQLEAWYMRYGFIEQGDGSYLRTPKHLNKGD